MKRIVKIVAVLAVAGLFVPAVMAAPSAATPWITKASFEGQTYRRPNMAVSETPVHMPGIASPGDLSSLGGGGGATAGPQIAGDDLISPRGGALVNPTGSGPMYTPQQQGDRQIELLIDRLG